MSYSVDRPLSKSPQCHQQLYSLTELWDECETSDSEIRARIIGVASQMQTFDYLCGVMLASTVLGLTDNLSKTLQQKSLSASEGQRLANLTLKTLEEMRSDLHYCAFWEKDNKACETFDVNEPSLPRK